MKLRQWLASTFVICLAAAFSRGPADAQKPASIVQPLAAATTITMTTTGLQVWRTTNGTDWQRSGSPGFDQADNARPYWDNSLTVYNDLLWVGTLNPTSGGEVWQSECMPYGVYAPLVCRDSGP